jgi:hypothetical protein
MLREETAELYSVAEQQTLPKEVVMSCEHFHLTRRCFQPGKEFRGGAGGCWNEKPLFDVRPENPGDFTGKKEYAEALQSLFCLL